MKKIGLLIEHKIRHGIHVCSQKKIYLFMPHILMNSHLTRMEWN